MRIGSCFLALIFAGRFRGFLFGFRVSIVSPFVSRAM
jgi:hypothetical protein